MLFISDNLLIPNEIISNKINFIRNKKVMIDYNLAYLFDVETKRINEQVKRNSKKFPEHFMFQLNDSEFQILKSQNATSSWGGTRKLPFVFTEHGILQLSNVLKSDRVTQNEYKYYRSFC